MADQTKLGDITLVARNAAWLAHRYDPEEDAVHLLPVPRAVHRQSIFLTDEHLPRNLQPLVIRRRELLTHAPAPAPVHFVFHSAFCCSTLIARAFDRPGWAMGLKEPMILNDLVGWRRRGGQEPDVSRVLDDALTLLGRPFGPGEAVVVKPSNVVNGFASLMLTLRPEAAAVLVHAPLRTYLGSIAKKGLDGRLWVRVLLRGLLKDGLVDLGFSEGDYLGLTDLQVAAVGWLAQQALFAALVDRFGAHRVRTLCSDTLVDHPAITMGNLSALFGLPINDAGLGEMIAGRAFTRHSKTDVSFERADRVQEHADAAQIHAEEIDKVARWTDAVATSAGVAVIPPAPLIEASRS